MKKLIFFMLLCMFMTLQSLNAQTLFESTTTNPKSLILPSDHCPDDPCPCKGGVVEMEVYYFGDDNVTIDIFADESLTTLIVSFANVVSGQLLTISAAGLPGGKFPAYTYYQVTNGGDVCVTEMFSTCPFVVWPLSEEELDPLGKTIGSFVVYSRTDLFDGQVCSLADIDQDWHVGGNVVAPVNNTLGTRNDENVVLISNDTPRGIITNTGDFGIGNQAPNATLDVTGDAIIDQTLDVNGIARMNDGSSSTSPSNGALIVTGGTGIGENLNVGNDATIDQNLNVGNDATIDNNLNVFNNGFVNGTLGVGTNAPARKFHVNGDAIRLSSSPGRYLDFNTDGIGLGIHSEGDDMYIRSTNDNNIFMNTDDADGKVGIGTTNLPNSIGGTDISLYKLYVEGGILTEEVRVRTGWADYVFLPEYQKDNLEEVENFIMKNGHLPNMPSAAEVENNGLEMGEITRMQQEKIEELFLYIIEMNKDIQTLKEENAALKKELKAGSN